MVPAFGQCGYIEFCINIKLLTKNSITQAVLFGLCNIIPAVLFVKIFSNRAQEQLLVASNVVSCYYAQTRFLFALLLILQTWYRLISFALLYLKLNLCGNTGICIVGCCESRKSALS